MLPSPGSVGAEPSDHRAPLGRTAWEADVLFHETQEPVLRPTSPLGGLRASGCAEAWAAASEQLGCRRR